MDWVHCNKCFQQPYDTSVHFNLTNCGHIFCDICLKQGDVTKCKMCGQQCCTIVLTNKLKPEIEDFFTKPTDLVKKYLKQLLQALEFQQGHSLRLASFHRSSSKPSSIGRLNSDALARENQELREQNANLKKMMSGYINQRVGDNESRTPYSESRRRTPYSSRPITPGSASLLPQDLQRSPHYRGRGIPSPRDQFQGRYSGGYKMHSASTPSSQPRTPAGPERLSIRTPPSNGSIGSPMPARTEMCSQGELSRNTGHQNNAGGAWSGTSYQQQYSSASRRQLPSQLNRNTQGHQSSLVNRQNEPEGRTIQLNFKPKIATRMTPQSTQHES